MLRLPLDGAQGDISDMRFGLVIGGSACLLASAAAAQGAIDINRSVYVERASGNARALEPASSLKPGDKVVLVMEWRAADARKGFTVQSAVPRDLAFQRAGSDSVEVSIDGGRSWGQLGAMRVGSRLASVEDVTNLRWRLPPAAAAQGRGMLTWSAIVR
jgi:hypothetical protein